MYKNRRQFSIVAQALLSLIRENGEEIIGYADLDKPIQRPVYRVR